MPFCKEKNEIIVCNTLFKYEFTQECNDSFDLIVTPCCTPTAVYSIGTITIKDNPCTKVEYYQGFVNADPVEIIQDCNIECIVRRMIELYFASMPAIDCNNSNSCNCKMRLF